MTQPSQGLPKPTRFRLQSPRMWLIIALLIPCGTGVLMSWHSLTDFDIWFHLRAGEDFIEGNGLPRTNTYSFSEPGHPWINHEWMFQVLAAWTGPPPTEGAPGTFVPEATAVQGWNILRLFLVLFLLGIIVAGDDIWKKPSTMSAMGTALAICFGLMLLWPRLTLRPELISYACLVLTIRLSEKYFRLQPGAESTPRSHKQGLGALFDLRQASGQLWWLIVLWSQFHGFSSVAPVILLLGLILSQVQHRIPGFPGRSEVMQQDKAKRVTPSIRQGVLMVLGGLIALMVTPNGIWGLVFPLRALGQFSQTQVDLRHTISELAPLLESPNSMYITLKFYWAGLIWGVVWIILTWGRLGLLRVLVFALAAFAAWTNQRSVGLFGLALILLHTGLGRHLAPTRFQAAWARVPNPLRWAPAGLLLVIFPFLLWPALVHDDFYLREGVGRRFGAGVTPGIYPIQAARSLSQSGPSRFFGNIDAAAFLLAHRPGEIYIDGRTEAYSSELWAEYGLIRKADEKALTLLDRRRVEAVALATAGAAFHPLASRMLQSSRWDLAAAGPGGLHFTRHNRATSEATGRNRSLLTAAADDQLASLGTPAQDAPSRGGTRQADLCQAAAVLYGFAGEKTDQERALRMGLQWRPDHPTLLHNLGNLLLDRGEPAKAVSFFDAALAANPRLVGSALNAGVCRVNMGDSGAAEEAFRRALGIDDQRFEAWANLAVVLLKDNRLQEGIRALERALEIQPDNEQLKRRLHQARATLRP